MTEIGSVRRGQGLPSEFRKREWKRKLEAVSGRPFECPKSLGSVYLVVDCSESMDESEKINQAQRGAAGFAQQVSRKGYRVGLVRFASTASIVTEAQDNIDELLSRVGELSTGGSTNMADGIYLAAGKLSGAKGSRVLCIVTDGWPDNEQDAIEAGERAKTAGIEIVAIGTEDANREFLQRLSSAQELCLNVFSHELASGIEDAAHLLPGKAEEEC